MLALGVLVLILPVPSVSLRRRMVRGAARLCSSCRHAADVLHPERLPPGACVVVANHSSYLDGIVLYAALPPVFGFVIKREMSKVPLANLLLRRIGAHYVDRGRPQERARYAQLLSRPHPAMRWPSFPKARSAHAGLMQLRTGAFVAARAGLPVVPSPFAVPARAAAGNPAAAPGAHRDRADAAHCDSALDG